MKNNPFYKLLCELVEKCIEYPPKHIKADITFNLRKFISKVEKLDGSTIK